MIRFFVGGLPKSTRVGGTARFMRAGKVHMIPKHEGSEWALLVGQIGREHAPAVPYSPDIPLSFTARFYMLRPSTLPRKVMLPLRRPDLDNLTDQFNGVFWADDSQIVDLVVRKRFGQDGRPGVEIVVEPVSLEAPRAAAQAALADAARS